VQRGRVRVKRVGVKPDYTAGAGHIGALTVGTPRPGQTEAGAYLLLYPAVFQRNPPYVSLIATSSR
jgi:hypothetical protein